MVGRTAYRHRSWMDSVTVGLHRGVAVTCALNVIGGALAVNARWADQSDPTRVCVVMLLLGHAALFLMVCLRRHRPSWGVVASALVCMALLGFAWVHEPSSPSESFEWWASQFVMNVMCCIPLIVAGRQRYIAMGMLVVCNAAARIHTWNFLPHEGPPLLVILGRETGPLIAVGLVVVCAVESLSSVARWADRKAATFSSHLATAQEAMREETSTSQSCRYLHDTVLHTMREVIIGYQQHDAIIRRNAASAALAIVSPQRHDPHAELTASTTSLLSTLQAHPHPTLPVTYHGDARVTANDDVTSAFTHAVTEALRNVAEHANSSRTQVCVRREALDIRVTVHDHGTGFDTSASTRGHYGISESIITRMRDVHGDATIASTPHTGTTVELRWSPTIPTRACSTALRQGTAYGAISRFFPAARWIILPLLLLNLWQAVHSTWYLTPPWPPLIATLALIGVGLAVLIRCGNDGVSGAQSVIVALTAWGAAAVNGWCIPPFPTDPYLLWLGGGASSLLWIQVFFRPKWEGLATGVGLIAVVFAMLIRNPASFGMFGLYTASFVSVILGLTVALAVRMTLDTMGWQVVTQESHTRAQESTIAQAIRVHQLLREHMENLRIDLAAFLTTVLNETTQPIEDDVAAARCATARDLDLRLREALFCLKHPGVSDLVDTFRSVGVRLESRIDRSTNRQVIHELRNALVALYGTLDGPRAKVENRHSAMSTLRATCLPHEQGWCASIYLGDWEKAADAVKKSSLSSWTSKPCGEDWLLTRVFAHASVPPKPAIQPPSPQTR